MANIRTELLILLALSAAAGTASAADLLPGQGFSVDVGGEYQLISQEYYRVITDTITTDLIETWQIDRDEIDDFILRTDVGYNYRRERNRFDLSADVEVSSERFLGRADAAYRLGGYDHNVKMAAAVESKSPYGDTDSRQEGYNHLLGYLRTDHRLGRKFGIDARIGYEWVGFAESVESIEAGDTTSYLFPYYDYAILSGSAGGVLLFSDFGHDLSWQAVYRNRQVPDSSLANYNSYRLEATYNHVSLGGYATMTGYFEIKDYVRPGDDDDYSAVELTGLASRSMGDRWEGSFYFQTDVYWYDRVDLVHRNYRLFRGELKSQYRLNSVGLGPLVRLEFRGEGSLPDGSIDYFSDAYNQWEFGVYAGTFEIRRLYFTAELAFGRRNYSDEAAILTPYRLVSPSLVAANALSSRLSVNILFDGVFERHERREDNTTLYLLTAGLSVRF